MSQAVSLKEEELGRRWDRCITDLSVKLGAGITLGVIASVLIFKRRKWPILIGTGFGIGAAYANCERDINNFVKTPNRRT